MKWIKLSEQEPAIDQWCIISDHDDKGPYYYAVLYKPYKSNESYHCQYGPWTFVICTCCNTIEADPDLWMPLLEISDEPF